MIRFIKLHVQRWIAPLLIIWLLLPAAARAQDLHPWQTFIHNSADLYTLCGEVQYHYTRGMWHQACCAWWNTDQWNRNNNPRFLYPADEWSSSYFNMGGFAGGVESVLLPNATTPVSVEYTGNYASASQNDQVSWYKARRWRPPVILVGADQIPIGTTEQYEIVSDLPSNQAIYQLDQMWRRDGLNKSRVLFVLENRNLNRVAFEYEKHHHSGIWSRTSGSSGDSVITLPPGQVLRAWQGLRQQIDESRSVLMWSHASVEAPWNQKKQDDYPLFLEGASRYLSPADAPRAANLQFIALKDGYSDDLNDWDGSRFDDVGNPYIGPQFTQGDVSRETGELMGEGIAGNGYAYFGRPDGDHKTDWFSQTNPADNAPTRVFWARYRNAINANSAYFGGKAGWWAQHKKIEIERGDYRTTHFANMGATVSGIEWSGVTAAMVETMPPVTQEDKNQSMPYAHIVAGPLVFQPGDAVEIMRIASVGILPRKEAIALGQRYLKWLALEKGASLHPNGANLPASVQPLNNLEKFMVCEGVKDTVFAQFDRAFTAFHGGPGSGLTIEQKLAGEGLRRYPDPPPPPDIYVANGPGRCDVYAWYPDEAMFDDADTGVDDFNGWRIYRKRGDPWVGYDVEIAQSGYRGWDMVAEIRHDGVFDAAGQPVPGVKLDVDHYNREFTFLSGEARRVVHFGDVNVVRGEPYYYAASAFDDGSQNSTGFHPGESLESGRIENATAQGGVGISVTAFAPGISPSSNLTISGANVIAGLGDTDFALSADAVFDLYVGRGNARATTVTVPATGTADNVTADQLASDIQSAVDAAIGTGKVTVTAGSIGKEAVAAATTQILNFTAVEHNVVMSITGINAVTRDEMGMIGGQVGRYVVVSPNPWSLDLGASLSSDQNQIFFDNLPPLATLKIFTETGDLVRTIQHTDGSAQEVWYQVNENAQLVKSGLYILAVVNAKDTDPATGLPIDDLPDQFVKFVIIR